MAEILKFKNLSQSEANTSTPKEEMNIWERLKAKGYDNSRVGQAFVMPFTKPRKDNQKPEAFKK